MVYSGTRQAKKLGVVDVSAARGPIFRQVPLSRARYQRDWGRPPMRRANTCTGALRGRPSFPELGTRAILEDSSAGGERVTLELEVEAASGQAEFAGSTRNVAAVFAERGGDHATLNFRQSIGEGFMLIGD